MSQAKQASEQRWFSRVIGVWTVHRGVRWLTQVELDVETHNEAMQAREGGEEFVNMDLFEWVGKLSATPLEAPVVIFLYEPLWRSGLSQVSELLVTRIPN